MSIADDTGDMVAGAMALGILLNQKSQDSQDANYWYNQALALQQQLNLQRDISASQDRVIVEKDKKIDCLVSALAERGQVLETMKQELAEQIDFKNFNSKQLNYALENMSSLRHRLRAQSASTGSIHALYEQLVDEIYDISDPSLFPSLREEKRQEIIATTHSEFEKKGKLCYELKLISRE